MFDDFIAAGEWLIAQHYTAVKRICIVGGSNGGLLVGYVVFAVVCAFVHLHTLGMLCACECASDMWLIAQR